MIITGNNIEILRTYADNTFDSCVTDPPYGLSFMGKKWDYDVPSVELWKEVLRVLKPGGHMLCACGTRTQHRMCVNIEDAGFTIRDVITWHYSTGFPKSLDVSKAIDKAAGADREVVGSRNPHLDGGKRKNYTSATGDECYGKYNAKEMINGEIPITAPSTDAAKQWNGFGTALKPATELWTLARKPLSCNTIAENVLKYGTGGLNIDGCRIEGESWGTRTNSPESKQVYGDYNFIKTESHSQGRFPANLVFSCDCDGQHEDGCPVGELDRQSGVTTSGDLTGQPRTENNIYGSAARTLGKPRFHKGDTGSASRFFYVAKASKSERNKGLEGFEKKKGGSMTGKEYRENKPTNHPIRENHHPTVKPVTLMRYLCRLITPPKGIILDPFNGSGTTGIAAKLEWFEYVGIEREHDYSKISEARQPPPDLFT